LVQRLREFADLGLDAVTLHPRFSDEKLRRRARHELLPELAAASRLPLIASGDWHGAGVVRAHAASLAGTAGVMVGRLAVVQPWLFRSWDDPGFRPDLAAVWARFVRYVREDFPEQKVFYRVKAFTAYFARNFHFGHTLFTISQSASNLAELEARAGEFLAGAPQPARQPDVQGLA
jgi:tRNA-dihydrouridine synthase